MSVSHIAGTIITVNRRTVQRCALCGLKLRDSKGVMAPVGPNGRVAGFATWEVGRVVRVTEGPPTATTLLPDTDDLPADSCLVLVED